MFQTVEGGGGVVVQYLVKKYACILDCWGGGVLMQYSYLKRQIYCTKVNKSMIKFFVRVFFICFLVFCFFGALKKRKCSKNLNPHLVYLYTLVYLFLKR